MLKFSLKFIWLYYKDLFVGFINMVGFINIKHDGIYRSKVFLGTVPKLGYGF